MGSPVDPELLGVAHRLGPVSAACGSCVADTSGGVGVGDGEELAGSGVLTGQVDGIAFV